MSDIYCRDCRACKYIGGKAWCACRAKEISDVDPKCDCFRRKRPTVFEHITESPETLAEKLVFWMSWHKADGTVEWYAVSTVAEGKWSTKAEAIDATIEKLKEVCNG